MINYTRLILSGFAEGQLMPFLFDTWTLVAQQLFAQVQNKPKSSHINPFYQVRNRIWDQAMWQTVTSDKSAVAQNFSNFQTFTPTYSYTCGPNIKTVVN